MKFICQLDYPDWLFVTRTGHEGEEFEKGKTTTVKQSGCGMCGAVMLADQLPSRCAIRLKATRKRVLTTLSTAPHWQKS